MAWFEFGSGLVWYWSLSTGIGPFWKSEWSLFGIALSVTVITVTPHLYRALMRDGRRNGPSPDNRRSDMNEIRELSIDELDMVIGAGVVSTVVDTAAATARLVGGLVTAYLNGVVEYGHHVA